MGIIYFHISTKNKKSMAKARTPNACGCKPNWCTNICYLVIGYFFIIPIAIASMAPGIIGMWNLGPDMVSKVIFALRPPDVNGDFMDEIPRSTVTFPPGAGGGGKGDGSKSKAAPKKKPWNPEDDLSKTELDTFKSSF